MLEQIETDARARGAGDLAAWGMDFPYWNPVSFHEHMGYVRADQTGKAVLVYKAFRDGVAPPSLHHPVGSLDPGRDRVALAAFYNGWCTGSCGELIKARDATAGLETLVDRREYDTADASILRAWGISRGLFVGGVPYRPHEPPVSAGELRRDLIRRAEERGLVPPTKWHGFERIDAPSAKRLRMQLCVCNLLFQQTLRPWNHNFSHAGLPRRQPI